MNLANSSYERIKEIIKKNKGELSSTLLSQIKSDEFVLLNTYFDLQLENIKLDYIINSHNEYEIRVLAKSSNLKPLKFF